MPLNSNASTRLTGGCLCGELRYEVSGQVIDAGYCHCRLCQRASGAPMMAWLTCADSHFRYTSGTPAEYHSSSRSLREFCPHCGTHLVFRTVGQDHLDVTMPSLDDPDQIKPQYHIWCASKRPWLQIGDMLPRFNDDGPDI
ncbi:GFA family protein [Pokkaliibacter sp. MBI-7]|uniref:GFA family protein n=1 Tax=Pokkaliibacter sp. MBI-7 TaxID=3040600 RepID=UPI00244C38C3|nr:GFA family protein [Pokkaliibacter sp. MBI-7]MDH2433313.1 GFA family protein [Pokkaliibacter sp. MBI-7]